MSKKANSVWLRERESCGVQVHVSIKIRVGDKNYVIVRRD